MFTAQVSCSLTYRELVSFSLADISKHSFATFSVCSPPRGHIWKKAFCQEELSGLRVMETAGWNIPTAFPDRSVALVWAEWDTRPWGQTRQLGVAHYGLAGAGQKQQGPKEAVNVYPGVEWLELGRTLDLLGEHLHGHSKLTTYKKIMHIK